MPDPFATAEDAAGYAYALPGATADGLLARATQAIVDAAGFDILSAGATVKARARHGCLDLEDVPLVTDVSAVVLAHDDGTTESVTDWRRLHSGLTGVILAVDLGPSVPGRHCGLFAVSLTQGLPSVPDSLKLLTCKVAYRFAATPPAMDAGITSRSVGGVSWSAGRLKPLPTDDLTSGELSKLAGIVPVRTVRPVPL